jgi:hypothetical protein
MVNDRMKEGEARGERYKLLRMDEPGPWTVEQVFDKITAVMKELPTMKEAVECLDYALGEDYDFQAVKPRTAEQWEDLYTCQAIVSTGGSEGIYVDVWIQTDHPAKRIPFGTYKTLREDFGGYLLMGQIAGGFTKLFEEWLWANRADAWNQEKENKE